MPAREEEVVSVQIDPVLPPARRRAMRDAGLWHDRVLLDDLERHVDHAPDRVAVVGVNSVSGQRTALTYAELARRADRIAGGLAVLGVEPGDIVSYQSPNWWEFVALHLALLRLGAVSNPLMPIFRERELGFMLGLAESKVFIVPSPFRGFDFFAMAERLRPRLPALRHVLAIGGAGEAAFERLWDRDDDPAEVRAQLAARRPGADDVVELLYTSGTTGEPKGAMHTSNTLLAALDPYIKRFGLSGADVIFMPSPLAHQIGFLYGIVLSVRLGATLVLQDVWNAGLAVDLMTEEGASFMMASTPFLADLTAEVERRGISLPRLRTFVSSGAPIPRPLVRRAATVLGAAIGSSWGMTENNSVTTTRLDDPPEKIFETDGCPIRGTEIRVVDLDGVVLPPDREGRLQSRGATNFVGYLRRPEWNGVDDEGWFETGDLARIDADGYVRITGRSKDVIIRGGENVPVVEVEGLIYQHPDVQEVAVVAMPDARLGERACAFMVLREEASMTLADLAAFLAERGLTRNYWPERLEVLAALPKTPSGKIRKNELRAMARSLADGASA